MSKVRFSVAVRSAEMAKVDLPLEIRRADLTLVDVKLASQSIEVPGGHYFVSASLPSGQQLTGEVEVHDGIDAEVVVRPAPEDMSVSDTEELPSYLWAKPDLLTSDFGLLAADIGVGAPNIHLSPVGVTIGATRAVGTAMVGAFLGWAQRADQSRLRWSRRRRPTPRLLIFPGNPLARRVSAAVSPDAWLVRSESVQFAGGPTFKPILHEGVFTVQLRELGRPPLNVILGAAGSESDDQYLLTIRELPDSFHTLDVHLRPENADALLSFRRMGHLRAVASLMTSDALQAERLLSEKRRSPIAAAVGAYTLLRLGELKRLHDWTANLMAWFPWLPDGLTVRAEHLARLGEHKQALAILLELPERGLPVFTDGFSIALDRLELYQQLTRELGQDQVASARVLLARLRSFAPFIDVERPFTTFSGQLPTQPSSESASGQHAMVQGIEVTSQQVFEAQR
jgi:hypothetical protein